MKGVGALYIYNNRVTSQLLSIIVLSRAYSCVKILSSGRNICDNQEKSYAAIEIGVDSGGGK